MALLYRKTRERVVEGTPERYLHRSMSRRLGKQISHAIQRGNHICKFIATTNNRQDISCSCPETRILSRQAESMMLLYGPNYNADFLILLIGQCIVLLQGKIPYFLINYSLTPYADVGSYTYESLKIFFWIFQLTGYYFSYYAVLAVRTHNFQPYRLLLEA